MLQGDVVDELLDDDGLADPRAPEQADLAALEERLDEVDDLDARLEHLELGALLVERGREAVDGIFLVGDDRPQLVDRLADDVHDPAERAFAHGHFDRSAEALRLHAPGQALGRVHGNTANPVLADMLFDFDDDAKGLGHVEALARDPEGGVDLGEGAPLELDVDDGSDDLDHGSEFRVFLIHVYSP